MACGVEVLDGRQVLSAVPDIPIGVVLQHQHVVFGGQLRHGLPPLQAEGAAAGVLEGGNDIDHLGMALPDLPLQILRDQAVVIHGHTHAPGLEHIEDLHGLDEGGGLHQDHVAGVDVRLAGQVDALQAAGDDYDVVHAAVDALGSQQFPDHHLPQVPDPLNGAVLQGLHAPGVRPQHLVGQLADGVHRQGLSGGGTAAEGDDVRVGHGPEQSFDHIGREGHFFHTLGIRHHSALSSISRARPSGAPLCDLIVSVYHTRRENSIPQKQAVPGQCPGTGGWSFQGNLDVSHLHGGDLAHVQQVLELAGEVC